MKIEQVAAQLYTLREFMKTPPEIEASLKKVKAIGYQAVQLSALGPIPEKDLAKILSDLELTCCVTHEPGEKLLNEPEKIIERLSILNCKITGYPHPSGVSFNTLDDVKQFARKLNQAGKVFRKAGVTLVYHNHHIEFRRFGDKTILEILYEETDPENLQGLLDTYWAQYGGGDPVAWCRKMKNRLPAIHLKDYVINEENKPEFAEIGQGNLDWKSIIKAAEDSGCLWYCVEQDICRRDPFESMKMSFNYIKENLTCI
ncbi:sugar phosphate isomerase/epimerase [Candidatus Sumerlaeota bacterium]|nr:sugar phosphate isomerase/epimerase [Candidatus Sumerlaeota bacterium]